MDGFALFKNKGIKRRTGVFACIAFAAYAIAFGKTASAAESEAKAGGKDTELDAITVKDQRHEVTTIERAGTTSVVDAADIDQKSSKLLKDELVQMPGIQVATQRKGTKTFYLRGYGQDKVAITVDGVPVIDTYSGSMDIDNIGLLDVSEIIVNRGTSSALYGTKGTAGAINIYKVPPQSLYAKAGAEIDHFGNLFLSLSHGARFGGFYYMLSGTFDKSKGYEISKRLTGSRRKNWITALSSIELYKETLESMYEDACAARYYVEDTGKWDHTNHTKYKTNAKIGYFITPDFEAGLTGFFNCTRMKNSTYHTDMRSSWSYDSELGHNDWVRPKMEYTFVNQSNVWPVYNDWSVSSFINFRKGSFSVKANAYFYTLSNKYVSYSDPLESALNTGMDMKDMTWSIWGNRTYGFGLYPSYRLSASQKISGSVQFFRNQHVEEEQYFDKRAESVLRDMGRNKYMTKDIAADYFSAAVEHEIKITSRTDISLGLSYDMQNLIKFKKKFGYRRDRTYRMIDIYKVEKDSMIFGTRDSFNPVAGIISEPVRDFLRLRASASYKTSFPSLQAYSRTELHKDWEGTYTTDTRIKPERSLNGNAGIEFSFFGKSLVCGLDMFYSWYRDKIVRYYATKISELLYRNIEASYLAGTETTISYIQTGVFDIADFKAGFTHTFSYSRNLSQIHNSFINKGKHFEFQPVHKFTIDFRTIFLKTNTSFFLFGYFEYDSVFYVMRDIPENNPTRADRNLEWSTKWFKPAKLNNPVMIDAKVSQKFYFFGDYELELYILCRNIFDDYAANPFNPGPGRTWHFGVKAGF